MENRVIYRYDEEAARVDSLLKGYLFVLDEVCNALFGPDGEEAMYRVIGRYFLDYLREKGNIRLGEKDPWVVYCKIVEMFTMHGFYSYVEMEKRENGSYWMLEQGQYAGSVWEEAGSRDRGMATCPLWSAILHGLSETGFTIVLDQIQYRPEMKGFESVFHFEKWEQTAGTPEERARKILSEVLLPTCSACHKIRDHQGVWHDKDQYLKNILEARQTHGICNECLHELYPDVAQEVIDQVKKNSVA